MELVLELILELVLALEPVAFPSPQSLPSHPHCETTTQSRPLTFAVDDVDLLAAVKDAVCVGGNDEDLDTALGVAHDEAVDTAAAVAAI